jgi:hypothetical protein
MPAEKPAIQNPFQATARIRMNFTNDTNRTNNAANALSHSIISDRQNLTGIMHH